MKEKINWGKVNGLVPTVIQDARTARVLMLAYMNKKALDKTLSTKRVWFYSRSKQRLWMKGEESGNYLYLVDISVDCDGDALLIKANPVGPTCHTMERSCFDVNQSILNSNCDRFDIGLIVELFDIIQKRKKEMSEGSYTVSLLKGGMEKINSKITEEAKEVCRAARLETKQRLVEESVDVLYHLMVLLVYKNVDLNEVLLEIKKRRK